VKRKINLLILPLFALLSACELFLGPEPDTSPDGVLRSLWNDFNNIHANLDFRMCSNTKYNSWYDVYHNEQIGYKLKVNSNTSEETLFSECAKMLKELNDPHVGLYAPGKFASSVNNTNSEEFDINKIKNNFLKEDWNNSYKNFLYGRFLLEPNIGYIYIESFADEGSESNNQEWGRAIDDIISDLADTNALVLDVRDNVGGEIFAMEYIAARFASVQKDYMKTRTKNGPGANDLTSPKIYTIKPLSVISGNKYGYTKPIVLITNKGSVSATEWLTMALRTQDHVTHVGTPTRGALSSRNDRSMINGWFYTISPERVTDMDGNYYEGIGISPQKEHIIINTSTDDEQLDYALKLAVKRVEDTK